MELEKKIKKMEAPESYKMVVISDIHAHLDLFKKLIHQVNLKDEDYLVILGDFMEKGQAGLEMLYRIRDLKERPNTFVLMGNYEAYILELLCDENNAEEMIEYIRATDTLSILKDTVEVLNIDIEKDKAKEVQNKLRDYLSKELEILSSLDTVVEFDQFIFVHAGIENREDWENSSIQKLLRLKNFLYLGHPLNKYVVCGHMPSCNYNDHKIDNSIIISHQRRIISIDGGVGVKSVAQLNALIVEKTDEGYIYSSKSVDEFEKCEVIHAHKGKETGAVKVAWPNLEVDVLGIGTSFSWCRKIDTKELLYIKNEFLFESKGHYYCKDDYISSMLEVLPNDKVSLIAMYGKYAYIMKDGHVGWTKKDKIRKIVNKAG